MSPSWLQSPWLWYSSGGAIALLSAITLIWALLWDRPRSRSRCPRCWYDMSAAAIAAPTDPWTCPECGRTGTGHRPLRRTRRRPGWAAIALLALLGAWLLAERPAIEHRGWMWLAPTWPLVQALPIAGADSAIAQELRRRLGRAPWPDREWAATMSDAQIASLFETCAAGTFLARPADARWRTSFGPFTHDDLLQIYYARALTTSSANPAFSLSGKALARVTSAAEKLADIHGELGARTRARWPRGMPILLEVPVQTWWHDHPINRWTHIRWNVEGTELTGDQWCTGHTELRIPAEGHVILHVHLEWVDGAEAPWKKNGRTIGSQSHRIVYDTVDGIDDIMQPITSTAFEQALAGATLDSLGSPDWRLLRAAAASLDAQTAFGLRFEYILRGEKVGVSYARLQGGNTNSGTSGSWDTKKTWAQMQEIFNDPALRIHVAWDPAWSLYNIDATKYWKGEFDITPTPAAPATPAPKP